MASPIRSTRALRALARPPLLAAPRRFFFGLPAAVALTFVFLAVAAISSSLGSLAFVVPGSHDFLRLVRNVERERALGLQRLCPLLTRSETISFSTTSLRVR